MSLKTAACSEKPMSLKIGSRGRQENLQWQPSAAAATGSSWLLYGPYALDARTLAKPNVLCTGSVLWSVWHGDGLHVILLHSTAGPLGQAQIRVYHAASGALTGLLDCSFLPDKDKTWHAESAGRYVSCKTDSVLVPVSQRFVSLCRVPSLALVAQLDAPMQAGKPADFCSMGWAAHGSLIAVAWQALQELIVTIHSGSDGRLHQTVRIESHTPEQTPSKGRDSFHAFAACSDQPTAAVAWQNAGVNYIAIINLATGTQTFVEPSNSGKSDGHAARSYRGYGELVWAPRGHYLMIYNSVNTKGQRHLRGIYAVSSGARCKLFGESHVFPARPIWSSLGKYCLMADNIGCVFPYAPSISGKLLLEPQHFRPPDHRTYFHIRSSALDRFTFVPGARDVVQLDAKDCPHAINHWVYNAETRSSTQHGASGLDLDLGGALSANSIAWHPTLKSAKIYALLEDGPTAAVHLIDMRRHCRLVTWTSEELAYILLKGSRKCIGPSIAWSVDGKHLAVVNSYGAVILDVATDKAS